MIIRPMYLSARISHVMKIVINIRQNNGKSLKYA